VVVFVRARDKARLGQLRIPTTADACARWCAGPASSSGATGCPAWSWAWRSAVTTSHY